MNRLFDIIAVGTAIAAVFGAMEVRAATSVKSAKLLCFVQANCGPCREMGPLIEQLQRDFPNVVEIVRTDSPGGGKTADRFNVNTTPTFLSTREGDIWERIEGLATADQLADMVRSALGN